MNPTESRAEVLKASIESVRRQLTEHPLYARVQRPADFTLFMQYHVYAVWDFMSLLKALQRDLTCVDLPWTPKGSPSTRYLINEIVLGEESDVDQDGKRTSHFELYLRAMTRAGADTAPISALVDALNIGAPLGDAIRLHIPEKSIREFLHFTFETIASGKTHAVASVFTFGREDLIPDLFLPIIRNFSETTGDNFQTFKYYLERHIEVDGDHHSHLAIAMLEELCGDDPVKWQEATEYAQGALKARILLWDAVVAALDAREADARLAAAAEERVAAEAAEALAAEEHVAAERAAAEAAEALAAEEHAAAERVAAEAAEALAAEERAAAERAAAEAAEALAAEEHAAAERVAAEAAEVLAAEERAVAKAAELARAAEAAAALETLALGAMGPKPKKAGGRKAKAVEAVEPMDTANHANTAEPMDTANHANTAEPMDAANHANASDPMDAATPPAEAAEPEKPAKAPKTPKEPKEPKTPKEPKPAKAVKPAKEEKPARPQPQQQALF